MFWRRKETEGKYKKKAVEKIEGLLWGYMVYQHGVIVDVLQNLRRVEQSTIDDKSVELTMIRIFDPASADKRGITIDGYKSLDDHPELILYEGYYREVGGEATDINIKKK